MKQLGTILLYMTMVKIEHNEKKQTDLSAEA